METPRYYVSHLKSRARAAVTVAPPTGKVELTGTTGAGQRLHLRRPRLEDAVAWSDARVRNQQQIEPYWPTSSSSWPDRNTHRQWLHECMGWRPRIASGEAYPSIIEVDGEFAGQCNLEWIDGFNSTAELGFWVDRRFGGQHLAAHTIRLVLDFAFDTLDLKRLSAPVHVDNVPGRRAVERAGLMQEGVMRGYSKNGGVRADHFLYAVTVKDR